MRILVLGGGGRENALCWKLAQSPLPTKLWRSANGASLPEGVEAAAVNPLDPEAVEAFARAEKIDLVVIGPEAPLEAGVSDRLTAAGFRVFGPSRAAAQLEISKSFTKEICDACGAPTARWRRFEALEPALAYVQAEGAPIVVKADGLAAGKGVTVAATLAEAEAALRHIFGGGFGKPEVVVEQVLTGEEASLFALVDGETAVPLAGAQDHKRAHDGDQGPNTGGMGAYSPAPVLDEAVTARAMERIIRPIAREMAKRGTPYRGVIFAGLMIEAGEPSLIEINARFGDPECQALMPRLESDLLPALLAVAEGRLNEVSLSWSPETCLAVVMAAKGYPGDYVRSSEIRGVEKAEASGALVFLAGARREGERLIAEGGRVLSVATLGATAAEAQKRAYAAVDLIDWPEGFHRRDIGARAVARGA
ncbi:phosphoribosylamine--glycine ligase [Neomegalonema sp.]|uniref:phosphoribosylamine--glycine ligase n=1 Tax=Neomegalonema sp. TaxID=2039713 RepID=UPI00260ED204|nr:phosphoribosylamine--glycine ligase [Neomegalonema sp.]MDD2867042.1 phosphoribosylamine--glycine ligase [Neomegalonema sp.]